MSSQRHQTNLERPASSAKEGSAMLTSAARPRSERSPRRVPRATPEPELLRRGLDRTFAFICLLGPDGTVKDVNSTALAFAGVERVEVLGRPLWATPWWTRGPPEQQPRLCDAIRAAVGGAFQRFEAEHRGRHGDVIAVDVSLTPVCGEQGDVAYLIAESGDITRHKRLDRLREDSIGCASHDIGNQVNAIVLHANLLERGLAALGLADELRGIRIITENAQRAACLLRELSEVVHLESPRPHLQRRPADLGALVRATVDRMPPAEAARTRVAVEPSVTVAVDSGRIERVVENLIGNACKYASPGTAILVEVTGDGHSARVSVSDRGPGLDACELARVFDKYQRGAAAGRSEGRGLGLYISRLIVEGHGGTLEARSTPGVGSTFEFRLPAAVGKVAAAAAAVPAPATAVPACAALARRIIVVDHDLVALSALSVLLRRQGYQTHCARNGREALDFLEVVTPDALLVDSRVPGMTWMELVGEMRRLLPAMPVVAMTECRKRVGMPAREREPCVRYVGKPIRCDELLRLLQGLLSV